MRKWAGIFGDSIEIGEDRDNWDYIWDTGRMAEARGPGLRSYRKNRSRFLRKYGCEEQMLTPALFDELRRFQEEQFRELLERAAGEEGPVYDNELFEAALDDWDDRYLRGTIYRVDGAIAGVQINEIIDDEYVVGIYQKQNRNLAGLMEYMSIKDCRHLHERGCPVLNVMQDDGEPGLRDIKMRSDPLCMLRKYYVTVR